MHTESRAYEFKIFSVLSVPPCDYDFSHRVTELKRIMLQAKSPCSLCLCVINVSLTEPQSEKVFYGASQVSVLSVPPCGYFFLTEPQSERGFYGASQISVPSVPPCDYISSA